MSQLPKRNLSTSPLSRKAAAFHNAHGVRFRNVLANVFQIELRDMMPSEGCLTFYSRPPPDRHFARPLTRAHGSRSRMAIDL